MLFHHEGTQLWLCGIATAARMRTSPRPFNSLYKGENLIYQRVVHHFLSSLNFTAAARSYLSHIDDTTIWNTWSPQQKHSQKERMNKGWEEVWSEANSQQENPHPLVLCTVYPRLLSLLWYVPDRCQRH